MKKRHQKNEVIEKVTTKDELRVMEMKLIAEAHERRIRALEVTLRA